MSASASPSEPAQAAPTRRRRWPRRLAWGVALLLGLPLLLVAAVLVGANTAPGRHAIERLAAQAVPGLTIEGLQGPLPGRPAIRRLTYADAEGIWLEVEGARLDWDPAALLRGEAHVLRLAAERLRLQRLPAAAPDQPGAPPGPLIPSLPQLPVAIRLDRLEVARIELAQAVLGQPVALHAAAEGRLDPWGLTLWFEAGTAEGGTSVALDAALRPGSGRLSARGALRGEPGGPLSRLVGLGERPLELDLTLDGPAEAAALTLRAGAGEGLSLDVAGTVAAPDLARLGATLEGQADASGLVEGPAARFAGPLELRLDASRMPDGLVDLRALRIVGAAGVVQAQGRLDTERDRSAVTLRAALPPSEVFAGLLPEGSPGWDALQATAEVTGALAAPRLALTVEPTGFRAPVPLLGPAPRLVLRATAPDRIELLTLAGQAIQAELRGRVGETLDLTFAAELAASGEAVPGLEGALRLSGTASGPRGDPSVTLAAQSSRLEAAGRVLEGLDLSARVATPLSRPQIEAEARGTLESLPLALALRGTPEAEGWLRLEAAEASFGPARLTAAGRVNPAGPLAEGEARLEAPDLAPFSRLLGQPIAGAVRLEAQGAPREGVQGLALRLAVPRLSAAGAEARNVTATVEGTPAALDLALSGEANGVAAEVRGRLTEAEGARRLDLAALRATYANETVRLSAPTRVTLQPDGAVELGATTLALPRSGTLRAEGRWGPERADLRATLAAVDLGAFAALVPDVAPAGTLAGEARVTGPTSAPELTATLRGSALRSGVARGLPPGELRLELRRGGDGAVAANGDLRIGPQNRIAAAARFPRGPGAALPFEGSLDGALDLGALSAPFLAAGADRVTGQLTLALRASGTPAAPVMGGEARLAGGRYRNGVLGVTVSDIAGTLRPDGPRLRAEISARTPGEGRIAVAGTIEPFTQFLPVDLTLTASNAQPVSSDLLRATLDAELRLAGLLGQEARLAGRVGVRRADIRVPEQLGGGVRSLGPVTERGRPPGGAPRAAPQPAAAREPARDAAGGPPVLLDLRIEAPRNVFVRGRGLDAELGGTLTVTGRLAAPQIGGALELRRGDIQVAGRRLAFERGRLAWDGGLLPDLNLRATSQAGQVTARLDVTGPPTAPVLTFSSTPELPQDEILARILFDRPLRDLSPFEIAQIAAAISGSALPGGGALGIVDRVRQGLGLDRLAVGGGGEQAARSTAAEDRSGPTLEAGRYVADGVYVGVRQGTESGSSRVGVRVDLTPRLKLEAETGDREAGNRVGLSWEWQWGR